ncbi:hypothetical protein D2Q93_01390 [Alicyclobacillaceae bacterium I2511]|nr:hypothetical protein D2Q93_01390 [Alicyclobacillaceae bacterium I2511]
MLDEFSIIIPPFHAKRTIRVYLPKKYYLGEQSYPVLYMHDGKNVFRDEDAMGGVSLGLETYLDEIGIELIVIGIDANSSSEGRVNELKPSMQF